MSVDGPVRCDTSNVSENKKSTDTSIATSNEFLAGSKGLESLSKIITSAETFFHPSNSGAWTLNVRTDFVARFSSFPDHICLV